ncbi:MAG: hypothetical protein ACI9EF_001968 [Pseudohongiellaceae bacterium]
MYFLENVTKACVTLVVFCCCVPLGTAGQIPFDQNDADAFNSLIDQSMTPTPNDNLQVQKINGMQMLTGMIGGLPLSPPIPLFIGDDEWLEESGSDGATTQRNGSGYNIGIVIHDDAPTGKLVPFLIHEAVHAFLGCHFPAFGLSTSCNKCEHQFVWSKSARISCENAQNCATDKQARDELVDWANAESGRC